MTKLYGLLFVLLTTSMVYSSDDSSGQEPFEMDENKREFYQNRECADEDLYCKRMKEMLLYDLGTHTVPKGKDMHVHVNASPDLVVRNRTVGNNIYIDVRHKSVTK